MGFLPSAIALATSVGGGKTLTNRELTPAMSQALRYECLEKSLAYQPELGSHRNIPKGVHVPLVNQGGIEASSHGTDSSTVGFRRRPSIFAFIIALLPWLPLK
ncbi:hypothetical protein M434DRAFT_28202 [Hypoxylon sp. CO27-5]|nr:hypothetical protein M434DRAFT_28202 [Hypoxylon sp. CO27-5]